MPTKWKYKTIQPKYKTFSSTEARLEQQSEDLNRAGMEGWELVSVIKNESYPVFYLKRPY